MEEQLINIYLATNVDCYGPYKGKGGYAAIMVWKGHAKVFTGTIDNGSDYRALEQATLLSLQSIKKDKMNIIIHVRNQPFVQGFSNKIRTIPRDTFFNDLDIYSSSLKAMQRQATVGLHWLPDEENEYFKLAKQAAAEAKKNTIYTKPIAAVA